jgi:hypothetical protein
MQRTIREQAGAAHARGDVGRAVPISLVDGLAAVDHAKVDRVLAEHVGRGQT